MRLSEEESAAIVLGRLYASEPIWKPHPKTGTNPAALGLSSAGETRTSFERRHASWADAVEREQRRKESE